MPRNGAIIFGDLTGKVAVLLVECFTCGLWARIAAPGTSNPDVLTQAAREERILRSFDKDRARQNLGSAGCVWRRAISDADAEGPGDVGRRLAELVTSRDDWAGHFSVIEPGRVRMRSLGQRAQGSAGRTIAREWTRWIAADELDQRGVQTSAEDRWHTATVIRVPAERLSGMNASRRDREQPS